MASPSRFDHLMEMLGSARVLRHLDRASLEVIVAAGRDETFTFGKYLPTPNAGEWDYVVISGRIRLLGVSGNGRVVTLTRFGPDSLFSLLSGTRDSVCGELAASDVATTRVFYVEADRLTEAAIPIPNAIRELIFIRNQNARVNEYAFAELAFTSLPERLYRRLQRLAEESEDGCVSETHDDLAQMVGATREPVTKALSRLREQGVIAFTPHEHRIRVLDSGVR